MAASMNQWFTRIGKLGVGLVAAGSILPLVLYNGNKQFYLMLRGIS